MNIVSDNGEPLWRRWTVPGYVVLPTKAMAGNSMIDATSVLKVDEVVVVNEGIGSLVVLLKNGQAMLVRLSLDEFADAINSCQFIKIGLEQQRTPERAP